MRYQRSHLEYQKRPSFQDFHNQVDQYNFQNKFVGHLDPDDHYRLKKLQLKMKFQDTKSSAFKSAQQRFHKVRNRVKSISLFNNFNVKEIMNYKPKKGKN